MPINTFDNGAKPFGGAVGEPYTSKQVTGRWPANLIHDGSEEVTDVFPGQDDKSASRFFYCAKANKKDRNDGCESLPDVLGGSLEGGNDKRNGDGSC